MRDSRTPLRANLEPNSSKRVSPEASTLVDVHPTLLFLGERRNKMCKSLVEVLEEETLVGNVHKVVSVADLEQSL